MLPKTDATEAGVNSGTYETDACKYGKPLPVNKFHDYFTSALPGPQKGPDVLLPLGTTAPIIADGHLNLRGEITGSKGFLTMGVENQSIIQGEGQRVVGMYNYNGTPQGSEAGIYDGGLNVDLSNATAATINQLYQAFAIQRLYQRDAIAGTRYTEIIKGHFNVISPDARLQRPEYLGGKRIPINIAQVIQTSESGTSDQGNVAAYSLTGDKSGCFTKSFTEHGIIIGVCCVRTDKTYQQGIPKKFSRLRRFDYYWPELANIGEQAILNKEIYAQGTNKDDEGFGYQEPWAEYRYEKNHVTGLMRSNATGSLDVYHFADNYSQLPTLGDEWIMEDGQNIDRTLAVSSATSDQFILNIFFKLRTARPMPVYSVPGLQGVRN